MRCRGGPRAESGFVHPHPNGDVFPLGIVVGEVAAVVLAIQILDGRTVGCERLDDLRIAHGTREDRLRLFGLSIIENFNYPILARNMRDFWRRWHISLGRWITQYLYFPIVAKLHTPTAPYIATFVAFMLIGWWHGSTLTYISWGVLHGMGLCTVMAWQRAMKRNYPAVYKVMVGNPVYIGLSWMATLFYVAWVQTFANQKSFGEALVMTRSLIGL